MIAITATSLICCPSLMVEIDPRNNSKVLRPHATSPVRASICSRSQAHHRPRMRRRRVSPHTGGLVLFIAHLQRPDHGVLVHLPPPPTLLPSPARPNFPPTPTAQQIR